MTRRRVLLGATLLLFLGSLATIAGADRRPHCPVVHLPAIRNIGRCAACGGATASGMHRLCGGCAARRKLCVDCGAPLEEGWRAALARRFAAR